MGAGIRSDKRVASPRGSASTSPLPLSFTLNLQSEFGRPSPTRITSTEQDARAATAAETLPSRNRPMRLCPVEPRKMQSASQLSASSTSTCFGLPSMMEDVTLSYAAFNSRPAFSITPSVHSSSSLLLSSTTLFTGGMNRPIKVGVRGSRTITNRASLPGGQTHLLQCKQYADRFPLHRPRPGRFPRGAYTVRVEWGASFYVVGAGLRAPAPL